jgi:hypothetical protein
MILLLGALFFKNIFLNICEIATGTIDDWRFLKLMAFLELPIFYYIMIFFRNILEIPEISQLPAKIICPLRF